MGYTGLPSFGHAAFYGIAAYVVGIMTSKYGAGFFATVGMSLLITTATAAVFGLVVSHMKGVYFLMITLALGQVTWGLAFRWTHMTGGDNGISGIPRPDFGESLSMWDEINFYYFVFLVFIICFVLLSIFIRSPFGNSLRGICESDSRMRILGYNVWLHKYLAYIVAGFFGGVSGILWAYYNGFVSTVDVEIDSSFLVFLMVILGGPGSLIGPAIGAGVIIFLQNYLSGIWEHWLIVIGLIYILTVIFLPKGLFGLRVSLITEEGKKRLRIITP
jgi:branched-chain amino acid transport system permease protein